METTYAAPLVSFVIVTSVGLYYYFVKVADRCTCSKRLDGKVVIITGSNTGIGRATAQDLASRGARIILACRDAEKGMKTEKDLREITGNGNIQFMQLDLASLESVKRFALEFKNNEDRLDILINNAGVINDGCATTTEGYELAFGVNHLGHFLLTNLLMDNLRHNAPSRVINVSSEVYMMAALDLETLDKNEGRWATYARSKLANILFTHELAKRLTGSDVSVFSLHPGSIDTDIKRNWPGWLRNISPFISFFFLKTAKDGAQTTIHCAVAGNIERYSGSYFKGCRVQQLSRRATDDTMAKELWDVSLNMTQLSKPMQNSSCDM